MERKTVYLDLRMNADDAASGLRTIRADLDKLNAARTKAAQDTGTAATAAARATAQKLEAQERTLQQRAATVRATLERLDKASPRALKTTLKELNRELSSGRIERGTQEWHRLTKAIAATRSELRDIREATTGARGGLMQAAALSANWLGLRAAISDAAGALRSAYEWAERYTQLWAKTDAAFANVEKYTGMNRTQVKELNEELAKIDTKNSREQLNALAADAGRLGLTGKKEILEFVEAADQINTALGEDLGADAVKNIGKLATLFGDDQRMGLKQAMLATGSVINELAQSSSAAEGYITAFTARLAGVGAQAGLTQAQVMAFAAVLDTSMVAEEKAATALQNVLTALYRRPEQMARAAGLQVKEFTQLLRTDANAALLQFVSALNQAGSIERIAPMLEEMHLSGAGATQTLAALAQNVDQLRQMQDQATAAFAQGTSVTQEAAKANATLEAQMQKTANSMEALRADMGEQLAPIFLRLQTYGLGLLEMLSHLAKFALNNVGAFASLTASGAMLTAMLLSQKAALTGATLAAELRRLSTLKNIATERAALLTTTLQTAALNTYRLAVLAFIVVKNTLTGATARAAAAQRLFALTFAATPWGAVLSVVGLLAGAVLLFAQRTKAATTAMDQQSRQTRILAQVQAQAARDTAEQAHRLRTLLSLARDHNAQLRDRRRAVDELNRIVPEYNGVISRTGHLERENVKAIEAYIAGLNKKAMAEALYQRQVENYKRLAEAKLTTERKANNVRAVNRTLATNKAYQGEATAQIVTADGFVHTTHTKRGEKLEELATQQKALAQAQKQEQALQAEIKATDELVKKMGLQTQTAFASKGSPLSHQSTETGPVAPKGTSKPSPRRKESTPPTAPDLSDLQQARTTANAAARLAWQQGQSSYRAYEEAQAQNEVDFHRARMERLAHHHQERQKAEQDHQEALKRQKDLWHAYSIREIQADEQAEQRALELRYHRGEIANEDELQNLQAAVRERALVRAYERAKELALDKETHQAQQDLEAYQSEQQHRRARRSAEQLEALRKEYAQRSATERYQHEVETLEQLYEKQLIQTEEYYALRKKIEQKYQGTDGRGGEIGSERKAAAQQALHSARSATEGYEESTAPVLANDNFGVGALAGAALRMAQDRAVYQQLKALREQDRISHQAYTDAVRELDAQRFAHFTTLAGAAFQTAGQIMTTIAQSMQSERESELAAHNAHYEQLLATAGRNKTQVAAINEERARREADIRSKYARREANMQIAQAVAQTAMNALSAYGSMVKVPIIGPVLAAAAAAAAIAAGGVQVAAIKQQAAQQEKGYYKGGFTGGRNYKKAAGVVHEGEFVANHQAVNNPQLLPLFQAIDYAQKHNTVSTLRLEDVVSSGSPRAYTQAGRALSPTPEAQAQNNAQNAALHKSISKLNQQLEQGIQAHVVLDGEQGLARQYERYKDYER